MSTQILTGGQTLADILARDLCEQAQKGKTTKKTSQRKTQQLKALEEFLNKETQMKKARKATRKARQHESEIARIQIGEIAQNAVNEYLIKSSTGLNKIDTETTADNAKQKKGEPIPEVQAVDTIEYFYPESFFMIGNGLKNFRARPQTKQERIKTLVSKIAS